MYIPLRIIHRWFLANKGGFPIGDVLLYPLFVTGGVVASGAEFPLFIGLTVGHSVGETCSLRGLPEWAFSWESKLSPDMRLLKLDVDDVREPPKPAPAFACFATFSRLSIKDLTLIPGRLLALPENVKRCILFNEEIYSIYLHFGKWIHQS